MCDVVPSELMTFYNDFSLESVEKNVLVMVYIQYNHYKMSSVLMEPHHTFSIFYIYIRVYSYFYFQLITSALVCR